MIALERVYHDGHTLYKVHDALHAANLTEGQIRDAITQMQNFGLLFRERAPDSDEPTPDHPLAQFFKPDKELTSSAVSAIVEEFYEFAMNLMEELPDGAEKTVALRKLLESRDATLRAATSA